MTEQRHEVRTFARMTPDEIKGAVRDMSKCRGNSGHAFVQFGLLNKITQHDGSYEWKGEILSMTAPDVPFFSHSTAEIFVQDYLPKELVDSLRDFSGEGTLFGGFARSSAPVTDAQLRIIPDFHHGLDRIIEEWNEFIPEENLEQFRKNHSDRRRHIGNVKADAKRVLSTPGHGGEISFGNAEEFGTGLWRMVWQGKKGVFVTRTGPRDKYEYREVDDTIAMDQADKDFINELRRQLAEADEDSESFYFLQINSTATVAICGMLNTVAAAMQGFQSTVTTGTNAQGSEAAASHGSADTAPSAESSGNGNADSSNGQKKDMHTCGDCGRTNDPSVIICQCRQRR